MMKVCFNLDNEHSPDPYNCHCALYLWQREIESTVTVIQIRAVLIVQIDTDFHHANSLNAKLKDEIDFGCQNSNPDKKYPNPWHDRKLFLELLNPFLFSKGFFPTLYEKLHKNNLDRKLKLTKVLVRHENVPVQMHGGKLQDRIFGHFLILCKIECTLTSIWVFMVALLYHLK